MVLMHGRTLCKTGLLALGPHVFIRYKTTLGLVAEVEDKNWYSAKSIMYPPPTLLVYAQAGTDQQVVSQHH